MQRHTWYDLTAITWREGRRVRHGPPKNVQGVVVVGDRFGVLMFDVLRGDDVTHEFFAVDELHDARVPSTRAWLWDIVLAIPGRAAGRFTPCQTYEAYDDAYVLKLMAAVDDGRSPTIDRVFARLQHTIRLRGALLTLTPTSS